MKKLKNIPRPFMAHELVDFKEEPYVFESSLTDKSAFIPGSSSGVAGSVPLSAYTFPDGKDDGSPVSPALRRGADIVEVSDALMASVNEAKASIKQQVNKKVAELAESQYQASKASSGSSGGDSAKV